MREIKLPPHASSLIQSMRDIGYSLETAIADLIDNSITANSDNVFIFFDISTFPDSSVVIIDDGHGMDESELLEAMRPGSRNPRERREENDLGRFGLGLKTASFSQCKSLTVVSRKNGDVFGARWDLDLISSRNEWIVTTLTGEELINLPFIDDLPSQGTYVLWQKLDRLLASNSYNLKEQVYDKFSVVEKHLALVFHRYLGGNFKKRRFNIWINGGSVEAFDPFCLSNKATQALHQEVVRIDGHEIHIQPYVLPHHSKLSKKEYEFYRTRSDFLSNQGAYIYRNGRLMAWGDWFRLVPKGEATKLARVQIDFPNVLDEHWTIDIKKSRAQPPPEVRDKLKQVIDRIAEKSQRVHVGRGDRLFEQEEYPLWVRYPERTGIRYAVNREHPLITSLLEALNEDVESAFETVLSVIERAIPLEAIYADYASKPQEFVDKEAITHDELKFRVQSLYVLVTTSSSMDKDAFIRMISGLKPFSEHMDATLKILEELA